MTNKRARKMAAPKGNQYACKRGEVATETIQCRATPSDKKKLFEMAKKDGSSFCAWMLRKLKS